MATVDAPTKSDAKLIDTLAKALVADALPGEIAGFARSDREPAAKLALAALEAQRDRPGVRIETGNDGHGRRVMRLAVANDDMPFLVDSIAGAVAALGLTVDRVLHPLLHVLRDKSGKVIGLKPNGVRTSLVYMEIDRADARTRRTLVETVRTSLDHVRVAVADWGAMKDSLAADADRLGSSEGGTFLRWLLEGGSFTQVGAARYTRDGAIEAPLGIAGSIGDTVLAPDARKMARAWLDNNAGPLLAKSNVISTVHRRAPLDLVMLKAGDGIAIHFGLWTSAALAAPPEEVPVLRQRLSDLEAKYGFDPNGHAGKALAHAVKTLPRDLEMIIDEPTLERLALTAMSLADRPRPELVLAHDPLGRHLFVFAWLPRDELSTARRVAIAEMIAAAADAALLSWSIDLGDSETALIRYTFDRRHAAREPDEAALREAVVRMVRGWSEAVEASLATLGEARGAARLALRYADAFPVPYRNGAGSDEAALDIQRLARLKDTPDRQVRLYRNDDEAPGRLRLKLYSATTVTLSDAVPALENFGFRVVEEMSTILTDELGHIHRFVLDLGDGDANALIERAGIVEDAVAQVLENVAENDPFNELIVSVGFEPRAVVLLRALFRYLRQTGLPYGLATVAEALRKSPDIARAIVELFHALHDPARRKQGDADAAAASELIERGLAAVNAIDEDRVLRLLRAVVKATLRSNFFTDAANEAIAFKFDSAQVPGLPAPVPWREIWVYSPRVEGIHLRAGPVARGGLRWSDRRDDFRTEILGLMKAQRVKNAVIVPTGAKGGFFPKALPDPSTGRDAWMAEGTESYRIFIRALLSVTDNIVAGKVVHPAGVVIRDGGDPYFVVAADKGTATFSDIANAIAIDHDFWLGDAFASGGSVGYDHKAMGITAKGAWISVQRHFAEMGVDVQTQAIQVVGCGDMSGDVFGNGMLLSQAIKLVAAFDHRHIFIDPDPDPAKSFAERARMFVLPRSSWADYDTKLISKGGGVFPRTAKSIPLSAQARAMLGITETELDSSALITAILKSQVDLVWFGGIGTYVKAASEANSAVGDAANDLNRVNAEDIRARAIGEGANLGVTQAGRIAFSLKGGRINTDFIDNSAGVDCSDNEVNIKIALNAEVATGGAFTMAKRNTLLTKMTDQVAALVLEDNRLQTLALSIAERDGAAAVPSLTRLIEIFETNGRLDRTVEGLGSNEVFKRRALDGQGLTRPELAVLLATSKIALQEAIEHSDLSSDPAMIPELLAAFPTAMQRTHADAIEHHQLRREIVATEVANRMINRLGLFHPFELAEEEGAGLGDISTTFVIAEKLFDIPAFWAMIDEADIDEAVRLKLFEHVATLVRATMADLLRGTVVGRSIDATISALSPGLKVLEDNLGSLLRDESRARSVALCQPLLAAGAPKKIVDRLAHLVELDGAVGLAALAAQAKIDPSALTRAFTGLGAALGLDWAQGEASRATPTDPWERLLVAGLARDLQQMRLEFLARDPAKPEARVEAWLAVHGNRVTQFKQLVDRARFAGQPTSAMLAQIAGQARVLLGRP